MKVIDGRKHLTYVYLMDSQNLIHFDKQDNMIPEIVQ